MQSSAATLRGTRRLSEVARLVVQPSGIVSTGWPDVERTCRKMGVGFDEWQCGAGRLALAKRADGSLAATVGGVGMSLPRQVGKTYLFSGLLFALCINTPGLLFIWTAHHGKTTAETFLSMQAFAKRSKVAPYVKQVFVGSGDEAIWFQNGSRILFGARERGFGRGIAGVDGLMFDEAQILSNKALESMLATMNTSRLGLHLYVGTPPRPEDPSETFTGMRNDAVSGEMTDSVWIECGADRDADPDDLEQMAKANPSYPHRTPATAFRRLRKKLTLAGYLREAYGIWNPRTGEDGPFASGAWLARCDPNSVLVGSRVLALEVSPDSAYVSLGVCGRRADGDWHVETRRARDIRSGPAMVADQFARHDDIAGPVVLAGRMASVMREALESDGREVLLMSAGEYMAACNGFAASIEGTAEDGETFPPDTWHIGDAELNAAIPATSWKKTPDGQYLNRRGTGDNSPLIAAVAARWAAVRALSDEYDPLESVW